MIRDPLDNVQCPYVDCQMWQFIDISPSFTNPPPVIRKCNFCRREFELNALSENNATRLGCDNDNPHEWVEDKAYPSVFNLKAYRCERCGERRFSKTAADPAAGEWCIYDPTC